MDHLLFIIQEYIESAQVSLRPYSQVILRNVGIFKENVADRMRHAVENIRNQNISVKYNEWFQYIKERPWPKLKIKDIYDQCIYFLVTEMTKTHIYFGGMCFVFGTVVGIGLGTRFTSSPLAPRKMKAVVANSYSGLESISLVEDMPVPFIYSSDQVLVQVNAGAVDEHDIKISEGYGRTMRNCVKKSNQNNLGEFPFVLGRSCAGVVVSVGKDVNRVEPGDEVWLSVPFYEDGVLSEFVVVSEKYVAIKSSSLNFEAAASLAYDATLALGLLVNQAGLGELSTAGKRILVIWDGSGVGTVVVQMVRSWGGHVTGAVKSRLTSLAQMIGVDDIIAYDSANFHKELRLSDRFDFIVNTVDPEAFGEDFFFGLPGEVVVTSSLPPLPSDSYGIILRSFYSIYEKLKFSKNSPSLAGSRMDIFDVSGQMLERATSLVYSGQLRAFYNKAYAAQYAEVAFQKVAEGRTVGKTVITFSRTPPSFLTSDVSPFE